MDAKAWRAVLGDSAWDYIRGEAYIDQDFIAEVMTRATEVGFVQPMTQPQVSSAATSVIFPTEDGRGAVPVLTAAGLLQHWRNRGHGWLILRAEELMLATAGPLFPWLQAVMIAYEERCRQQDVEPLPLPWRVFVGGTEEGKHSAIDVMNALFDSSPRPNPKAVQRLHIAGPGQQTKKG